MNRTLSLRLSSIVAAMVTATLVHGGSARADSGSRWFDQYTDELDQRLQLIYGDARMDPIATDNGSAGFDHYVDEVNQRLNPWAHPAPFGTALAGNSLPPSFDAYLGYLAQRIDADAGKTGPVIGVDTGSAMFDRYVEEINYRLQTLRQASESTGID